MKNNNVREVALETILTIEKNKSYSNLLLNNMINKYQLKSKDVGLLTEIVYGTIQRKDTLAYFLKPFLKKKIEDWVQILLYITIYQMRYLDRVPDHAAIYEAVEIAKKRGHKGIVSMVNGVLRNIQRQGFPLTSKIEDPLKRLSIETSHPLWLIERWNRQIGMAETTKMCETNILPPHQSARVNTSKITRDNLIQELADEGLKVEAGQLSIDSIVSSKGNLATTNAFKDGLLTIQDESSMLVARVLNVHEGDIILDSCAAPGGKTTHIAELLKDTGKVISLDLHKHKIKLINEQVERLGLQNVETMVLDSRNVQENFQVESFDKVLVDAPCSGLGVIRRKPDMKYTKTEQDIMKLADIQFSILNSVASLLKKGGTLVYSTCTIDMEENSEVINKFIMQHPNFELDQSLKDRMPDKLSPFIQNGQVQILPHYFDTDGFFIACLKKQA